MRYRPKPALVEAFKLVSGRYVVVPEGGAPRLAEADEFEDAFELAEQLDPFEERLDAIIARAKVPENPPHPLPSDEWTGRQPNRGRGIQVDDVDALPEDAVPLREAMRAPRTVGVSYERAPGVPLTPEDFRVGSDKLAEALAARTVPGGPGSPPPVDVDRAIAETREQLEQEARTAKDGGDAPKYRLLAEGEKPGPGRKECRRCHWTNPPAAKKCVHCRKPF